VTDAALAALAREGDAEAFGELMKRHYESCTRFARRMLDDRDDADDALQETFVHAWRGLPRYRERDAFSGWLYRILVNECRRLATRRWRRRRRFVQDETLVLSAATGDGGAAVELRDELQHALAALEPLLREAFLLKHGEGLEYADMSRVTGASVPALKMRVKRACEALRPRFQERS
jgi:RNA polymerase sigma-70 factor (ECF subfamily)